MALRLTPRDDGFVTLFVRSSAHLVEGAKELTAMLGAVAAGEGIALVPSHAAKKPLSGCRFIPLQKPAPHAEALLVRNLDRPADDAAELEATILKLAKNLG